MSTILDDGNDWYDVDWFTSPPIPWNLYEDDGRFYYLSPAGRTMQYTGEAPLPASLTVQWEILADVAAHGNMILEWDIGEGTQQHIIPEKTTGQIGEYTIDLTGAAELYLGVNSNEDDIEPYTYTGLLALSGVEGAAPPAASGWNCDCQDERPERTLLQLRRDLLMRLGFSAQIENPPPGMADLLDSFINSSQRILYRRYAALRTERFFRWTMEVGQRFYGIRADESECEGEGGAEPRLDPHRISWVGYSDDGETWQELACGIDPSLYTQMQNSRPERYEVRQCIEIWPPPNEAYILRVKGHFGLNTLVADEDQPGIDSEAIFLHALGTAKRHYRHPDGGDYFQQLTDYIGALVAGSHHTRRYVPGARMRAPLARPRMTQFDDED